MPIRRDENGVWSGGIDGNDGPEAEGLRSAYIEAVPRYLNCLDPVFARAQEKDELQFLFSLFRVRGLQDAGWDPYETTVRAIPAIVSLFRSAGDSEAARHLALWVYGHIVEASEPYELLANLLDVTQGGGFTIGKSFPPKKHGGPMSPGEKIRRLHETAAEAGIPEAVVPLTEVWDRELRNAVFHADYTIYGDEVRILNPPKRYSQEETALLVDRALAYHSALSTLFSISVGGYKEPKVIPNSPRFTSDPQLRCVVIVREDYGAVGVKDAWTPQQLKAGKIPIRLGRFTREEVRMLDEDHTLAILPRYEPDSTRNE